MSVLSFSRISKGVYKGWTDSGMMMMMMIDVLRPLLCTW